MVPRSECTEPAQARPLTVAAAAWFNHESRDGVVHLAVGAADPSYCGGSPDGEPWVLLSVMRGREDTEIRLPASMAVQLAAALVDRSR
jgi:hypothetical protein